MLEIDNRFIYQVGRVKEITNKKTRENLVNEQAVFTENISISVYTSI